VSFYVPLQPVSFYVPLQPPGALSHMLGSVATWATVSSVPWALERDCSVPRGRSNGLLEPPLGASLPPGALSVQDDVRECCAKHLSSPAPQLGDTALCSTLHRAWTCTGSHWYTYISTGPCFTRVLQAEEWRLGSLVSSLEFTSNVSLSVLLSSLKESKKDRKQERKQEGTQTTTKLTQKDTKITSRAAERPQDSSLEHPRPQKCSHVATKGVP
jgi:hypothetical protein